MGRVRRGLELRHPTPLLLWHQQAPTLHSLAYLAQQCARYGHRIPEPNLSAIMHGTRRPMRQTREVLEAATLGAVPAAESEWYTRDERSG